MLWARSAVELIGRLDVHTLHTFMPSMHFRIGDGMWWSAEGVGEGEGVGLSPPSRHVRTSAVEVNY